MLESGEFATMAELARREGIAVSYLTRVLCLTLLAPKIVEATLNGRQPDWLTLQMSLEGVDVKWERQSDLLDVRQTFEFRSPPVTSRMVVRGHQRQGCEGICRTYHLAGPHRVIKVLASSESARRRTGGKCAG